MRLTQFGLYTFPLYNKRDVLGGGSAGGALVDTVGAGSWDGYGTEDAPESATEIVTAFEIIQASVTAMQTARDEIRALRGTKVRLWAHMPDGTDRFVWARLSKIRMEARRDYVYYQPVELTFEVAKPGWNGTGHGATWYLDQGELLDNGLYLDYAEAVTLTSSGTYTATLTNGGNRAQSEVLLTFRAGVSAISNITVVCGTCDWTWYGTVEAGKELIIDTSRWSILNDGLAAYTLEVNNGHTVAEWLRLEPGNNTVIVTYTCAGNTELEFGYYDGWQ